MRFVASLSLCLFGLFQSPLSAAGPRDELLKRVPDNVGFLVVVNDLRGHIERVQNSPFAKKYLSTARGKAALASPEWDQLVAVNQLLKKEIGAEWSELRDGILGDAVVFLYVPGPPEHPEQEESLVLIHARDPKLAQRIYSFIDDAQTKSGQLKEKSARSRGEQSYFKRVRNDESDEFSYFRGPLVAFGNSERLLQEVIDRDLNPEPAKLAQEIDRMGLGSSSFLWWVNPRAFDGIMAAQQKKETGPAAMALAVINQHWKALDGVALSYHLDRVSEFRLSFAARPDAMPASTRLFLSEMGKPSKLSSIFSKDALVTLTGRVSIPAVMNFGSEFLPGEARSQLQLAVQKSIGAVLGDDVIAALPQRFGPDWGVCISPPAKGSKGHWPIALAAVYLSDSVNGPAVINRVMDGLNALATLAVVGFNSKNPQTISLQSEIQGDVNVRYITPPKEIADDFRPSFAWKEGYLLVASHPDGIRQFTAKPTTESVPGGVAPLLNISAPAWAKYLRNHRKTAVTMLTKQDGFTTETANRQLDAALEILDMIQNVGVTIKSEPGRAVISFQVKPVESFVRPEN